jgi:predicted transposase/invertase (TIGR01784 family)
MRLGYDPKVDYAFKKVFGEANAPVLIDLLHAVVLPARLITGLHYLPPHSEKVSPEDKQVVGDIRARDQGGRQFHLEMQLEVPRFFPKRALFSWAKFHPEQLRAGENYATLRPTISVCFVNGVLFPEAAGHHRVFRLREEESGLLLTDDLEIHLLELPKFTKTAEELSSPLDRWLFFLRHGAELDPERLPPGLDVPMIRRAMEVLTVFTQDEIERAKYEASLKLQRDQLSILHEAREDREEAARLNAETARLNAETARLNAETARLREAMDRDREAMDRDREAMDRDREAMDRDREAVDRDREAVDRALLVRQVRLCQEFLRQPPTPEAELTALPVDELAALLARLRQQALPNRD